jgi:murein L,D-transpeptidase YcbB/YkuD
MTVYSQVKPNQAAGHIRSSPAYAEVVLRTAEVRAELESIAADYTEESPRIIDLRYELAELLKASERLTTVRAAESGKLTLALGKLLVRKATLETDLARLLRNYTAQHADVLRVRKKVEIFDAAIRDLLT